MGAGKQFVLYLAAGMLLAEAGAIAQNTGRTVRRHRVAAESAANPPELVQAEAALDKNDYSGAEPLLKQVVERDAGNYRAWFDLGYVYTATNRNQEAIAAYRKSVGAKPDVFESNLNLGLSLIKANNPEAEQYLRNATQLKPSAQPEREMERAWLSLGKVIESTKPREAVEAYLEAAKAQPKDPEPHLSAGAVLERQNDFGGAEREYKQAALLSPNAAEPLAGLVNVYIKSRRLPEAEEALRRYLVTQRKDGQAHIQLGHVLEAQGKHEESISELEQGIAITPDDADAARELASAYENAAKYEKAEALYRSLLQRHGDDPALHFGLASALIRQYKYVDAEPELLATLKLKPDFSAAYGDLAVTAAENKNYELALKALDARARFLPENPGTYFLRATTLDHLKMFKPAAENYRQFLALSDGKNPEQEWQARHRLIAIDPKGQSAPKRKSAAK
ncbi:MAG TPA: tetratricopeptide repeat protein [Terriglobales bacterium]|nr:tetratricopeptide repeat protein [Terriglobales bacterium]